ncbi:putative reverse transcriptase rna-dependent dna polymerase, partial [Operophtera brumata]
NKPELSWVTQDIKDYKLLLFEITNISKLEPNNESFELLLADMNYYYDFIINGTKQDYYTNSIKTNLNTTKAMWNVVNRERGKHNTPRLDFTDVVINSDGSKFARSACYALSRVGRVVSVDVVRACYFATVHSLLQYGTELWSRAADWERAFRMQKRAVRAIVRIRSDETVRPHFKELGILTLPCIAISQVALYVRKNLSSYATHGDFAHQ